MQLKVIGQSAENYPPLKGITYKKEATLKAPKIIMDKATLIRLTANCLPDQTPPILLKNASDHLRKVKDNNNKFKVSDLLFHSAKSNKQSEFKHTKSGKAQQSPISQIQFQSSQLIYQSQPQGSFSLATIEDLETNNRLNTCLNYPSTGIHRKTSSKPYLEELQSIKGSLNEFGDKDYPDNKKDKNINKHKDSKINKMNPNRQKNCDLKLIQNDKQVPALSNYISSGNCITSQSTDPDEITKQLIKQNLMIFSRRTGGIGNQSSRSQPNQMKSSDGFQNTNGKTERIVLQSSRDSFKEENTIKSSDQNVLQYQAEAIKSLQSSLRSIPALKRQTQLTPCGALDTMDISEKDINSEKSTESTTQISSASSPGLAGSNEQKNSNIIQESKNDIFDRDIQIIQEQLKFQENQRQLIRSSNGIYRKFKKDEQVVSKYEYPIQLKQIQLIDKDAVKQNKKQPRIISPSYLNGCSPLKDLSKKRPQTARIVYKRLSTVPDRYKDNCDGNNCKPTTATIEMDKHSNIEEDIVEKEKSHTHRNVRSQSPKEEIDRYEQFLCRVLRSERTAVFERIKSNGIAISQQRNGSQSKLQNKQETTSKLLSQNTDTIENKEAMGQLKNSAVSQLQELKDLSDNKQEEKQQHGKVCPWQEWNEEIGYDEASLDFIHYANSP